MRRSKTGSAQLREAKNFIRGSFSGFAAESDRSGILKHGQADLGQVVSTSLDSLPLDDFPELVSWFRRSLAAGLNIYPRLPLRSDYKFEPVLFAGPKGDVGAIIWLVEHLVGSADTLKRFQELSDNYESACFSEDYDSAKKILATIEDSFGSSLWLIQARISFLQFTEGADAQKQYAKSIQETIPQTLPSFIAHYTSQRNEEKITLARYTPRIERVIAQQFSTGPLRISEHTRRAQESLRAYLRFFLLGSISTRYGEIAKICTVAPFLSPIDSYEILLRVLELVAKSEIYSEHWPSIGKSLNRLVPHLSTIERISKYFLSSDNYSNITSPLFEELFFSGRFDQCELEASRTLKESPQDAEAFRYLAMSAAILGREEVLAITPAFLQPLATAFVNVYRRRTGLSAAADEICKFALNFRAWRFAKILDAHFSSEWRDDMRTAKFPAVGAFFFANAVYISHALTVRPNIGRMILGAFDGASCPATLETVKAQVLGEYANATHANEFVLLESLVLGRLTRREFSAANSLYLARLDNAGDLWKRRAASHSIEVLALAGNLDQAIQKIVELCCGEDELRNVIPFRLVLGGMKWRELSAFKSTISLPIAIDLFVRTVAGDEHVQNRRYAYEEFRVSAGNDFPSRLDLSKYPLNQQIYFYSRICVPSIMDFSFSLFPTSSRALDEERTRICALLTRLDPDPAHVQAYNDEIRDITTRQKLQDGLRDINSSRVYVNVEAIKRWALNEFSESFEQCKPLLLKSQDPERRAAFNESMIALIEGKFSKGRLDGPVNLLSYPDDEGAELFVDIIETIGEEYLSNADNGLVAYLSSRIRHGSFAGHLRAPVEDAKIITVRSKDTKSYEQDKFWVTQFPHLDAAQRATLQKAIEEFSKQYDAVLDDAVENFLFIQSPAHPNGLIGFHNVTVFHHVILNRITEELTFAQFIDLIFEFLPAMLLGSLEDVQAYISQEMKLKIESCFEALLGKLERGLPLGPARRMTEAVVEARQGAHRAIVTVANWFKTARNESEATNRTFDEILDIAIAATKSANHGFNPQITRDVHVDALLYPASLHYFTDIFFIIFTNIANHSKDPGAKAHILVQQQPTEAPNEIKLRIRVENDVAIGDQPADQSKLNQIRTLIDKGEYQLHANKEGGSGLLKLRRYISTKANQSLDFGFVSDDRFFVELQVILTTIAP